ncbi:MAG: Mur ligase family protein, partial [Peptostreptococcaceae bacterium]|nr:Mur ligase family protein [Peptostreptococcaceae bacterium]
MNYEESLAYISSTYPLGIKLGLENIERLLERLGNPQEKMRIIHVAGTNGKGSTCAFLSSMLTEAGFRVGLYTSPYLEVFNERIRINGENIGNEVLALAATKVRRVVEELTSEGYPHPSEFEVTTAIGFVCFEMEKAEIVVLEVGLGGRFDATNAVKHPLITVITSVSIDHVQFLGDTLGKIAFEKAGILKPGVPLVLYPQEAEAEEEILRVAGEKKVPVTKVETGSIRIKESSLQGQRIDARVLGELFSDLEIGLLGEHQTKNA